MKTILPQAAPQNKRQASSVTSPSAVSPSPGSTSPVRNRLRREPVGGLIVEKRDLQLLSDLFRHGVMARGHLQAFYFSSLVRANARLRQLFDHGLVSRLPLPGLTRAQSCGTQALYALGCEAVPLVAAHLGLDESEVRRAYRRTRTGLHIAHSLAIVEARLAFHREAQAQRDVELELWLAEGQIKHEYQLRAPNGAWQREVFKPDGFARLKRTVGEMTTSAWSEGEGPEETDRAWDFFLEVDMGSAGHEKIWSKWMMHRQYLVSGLFRDTYHCERFHTLVLTASEFRVNTLLALLRERAADDPWRDLFLFATFDAVEEEGILGPVWTGASAIRPVELLDIKC